MKTTSKYNKSKVMKNAWMIYREDNIIGIEKTWSEALKEAWSEEKEPSMLKELKQMNVKDLFDILSSGLEYSGAWGNNYSWDCESTIILEFVKENSKTYKSNIAERALLYNRLSDKQAWSISYEFKNIIN